MKYETRNRFVPFVVHCIRGCDLQRTTYDSLKRSFYNTLFRKVFFHGQNLVLQKGASKKGTLHALRA